MRKILQLRTRKRRAWSAGTIALSVAAHLLLVGGLAFASLRPPAPAAPAEIVIPLPPLVEAPPPAPPEPAAPQAPALEPKRGDFEVVRPPETVPERLPQLDPGAAPVDPRALSAIGEPGDVIGPPTPEVPLSGSRSGSGAGGEPEVIGAEELGVAPVVRNAAEVRRLLERLYPAAARDAGLAAEVRVQMVVNTDGTVDPASIVIVSASDPRFAEPARRAAERFRFAPANLMGEPVRVLVSLPIRWMAPAE